MQKIEMILWVLNVLLENFNLAVTKLGFFYVDKKENKMYLIDTDINKAFEFLKLNCTLQELRLESVYVVYSIFEESPYYNKAQFMLYGMSKNQQKIIKDNMYIETYMNRVRDYYDLIESNYKYTQNTAVYDLILGYHFGNIKKNISSQKVRKLYLTNFINTDIICEKYNIESKKQSKELIKCFKNYIEKKGMIYEQEVVNRKEKIYNLFEKFLAA